MKFHVNWSTTERFTCIVEAPSRQAAQKWWDAASDEELASICELPDSTSLELDSVSKAPTDSEQPIDIAVDAQGEEIA